MKRAGFTIVAALLLLSEAFGATIEEDFAADPASRGWRIFGEAELFVWDPGAQNLQVTWDSSKPNSYFYRPLGTVLGKSDDVRISFDLRLEEIVAGVNPEKPFTFELAAGLINLKDATSSAFLRGTGSQSPNLLELDYFPDTGFGATVSPIIVSSNNQFFPSFTAPLAFTIGNLFHIEMRYTATNQTLATTLSRDGEALSGVKVVQLGSGFTDYRVDALSISSYSDEGAGGSVFAKGRVDDVTIEFPDPPRIELRGAIVEEGMEARFVGRTNWLFTLERTADWKEWRIVSPTIIGDGSEQLLRDEAAPAPASAAFYRVRAERAQ